MGKLISSQAKQIICCTYFSGLLHTRSKPAMKEATFRNEDSFSFHLLQGGGNVTFRNEDSFSFHQLQGGGNL